MQSEHCIIYAERSSNNRKSAIIFGDNIILAPATILFACISRTAVKRLAKQLVTFSMIDATDGQHAISKELLSLKFRVVHKRQSTLVNSTAQIAYVFNCKNISESVDNLLDNFEPLVMSPDGLEAKANDVESAMSMFLLSAFVVLKFNDGTPDIAIEDVFVRTTNANDVVRFDAAQKLEDIASVTTPFTNEVFFGTVNVGKVANVFGQDDCLFVGTQPLVGGCEGGAVYNRRMNVIGMVICTSFRWKNSQNASLTLVASFYGIVKEFIRQSKRDNIIINTSLSNVVVSNLEKSVLLIQIGLSGGSGCLLKVNGFRFILTCSHVVFNVPSNTTITCYWRNGSFTSDVIYKNPNFSQAYDVALLTVPDHVPDEFFTECNTSPPTVGTIVYATGFPHFFALAKHLFAPSVFVGRITKVHRGLIFTDTSVQAGQSGGPLLNADGRLVGVTVSNSRDAHDQIYPNVNMCIPICDIYDTIFAFTESRETTVLNGFLADADIVRRWNLQPTPSVLSSKL